ncbi:hypothetical protein AWRIB429_1879 [Oenococcus oeni AWRIB429]|uniref:Uncharacterized protein n=1 Tax=Oenococcus oeni AWRIB429 TaxID=655225 RepID=D3LBZ9_OENOE|nr:hypothetical protein AWRIB429_1879 [Oenococcus oeni AWRIB429]
MAFSLITTVKKTFKSCRAHKLFISLDDFQHRILRLQIKS